MAPVLLEPSVAHAQSDVATLTVVVTDASSARISGATVRLTNRATGAERHGVTDARGTFTFAPLTAGQYLLRATRDGFAPTEVADVALNVGDRLALEMALSVGGVTDEVTVAAPRLTVRSAGTLATVIDRALLQAVPLNGRSIQTLLQQAPGVVPTPGNLLQQGQFSVNGQRDSSNMLLIDGVSANVSAVASTSLAGAEGQFPAYNALGGTNSLVSVDAIEEFAVQTSSFAPEFGRTPGGQVSIVTRSGSNQYRGSAFEYVRDDALDANDWFVNQRGLTQPELSSHQFGGVLGGPVVRSRLFFFGAYEGLRLKLPQVAVDRLVPSLDARARATGAMAEILNAFPLPNGGDAANGFSHFSSAHSNPSEADTVSARVDYRPSDRWTFFGRYSHAPSWSGSRGTATAGATLRSDRYRLRTMTGGATWIVSPTLSNDLRVNYSSNRVRGLRGTDDFGGAVPAPPSAILPPFARDEESEYSVYLNGFAAPLLQMGASANSTQRQINIVDSLTYVRGAHVMKAGVDYRHVFPIFRYAPYRLYIYFNGIEEALAGRAFYVQSGQVSGPLYPRYDNLSLFAQDTWRVHDHVTLTYGLRWELNPAPTEANGNGIRTVEGVENFETMTLAPAGTRLWPTSYTNFAPRAGLVYQLTRRPRFATVLRGGGGLFYDLTSGQVGQAYDAFNFPYSSGRVVENVTFPLDPALITPPPVDLEPDVYPQITAFDPSLTLPRTTHWNVAVEQALGDAQSVSVAYVGAAGRHQYRTQAIPQAGPRFENLRYTRSDAWSDYRALQVQFQRRLSRGWQATAAYTLSKATDTWSSEALLASDASPAADEGPAAFDRRHNFSAALAYRTPDTVPGAGGSGSGGVSGVWRRLAADWLVSSVIKAFSGAPIDVVYWGNSLNGVVRPNVVPGEPFWIADRAAPGGRRLNLAAFSEPPDGTNGTMRRNSVRGFGAWQIDAAVSRRFPLRGRTGIELRLEAFNLFNLANFADPSGNLSYGGTGAATTMLNRGLAGQNVLYQIGGPRSIQLGARVEF